MLKFIRKRRLKEKVSNMASRGAFDGKKHLGTKAVYMYTGTWNKTFGELAGMYPKWNPSNAERYKRGSVYFKALLNEMRVRNVGTIYRGVAGDEIVDSFERKTFSSFSTNIRVADSFAFLKKDGQIMSVSGAFPCVRVDDPRYRTQYNGESEIILPPGIFERDYSKNTNTSPNGRSIVRYKFRPIQVNINQLHANANKKYNYSDVTKKNIRNISNYRWNRVKLRIVKKSLENKKNNLEKLKKMNQNKEIVKRSMSRIQKLINENKKRANLLERCLNKYNKKPLKKSFFSKFTSCTKVN